MLITKRPLSYWFLNRCRWHQAFLILVIFASLFFKVFPLEMQKRVINTAIRLKDQELLFLYCGLYIGAVLAAGLLKYLINVWQRYIGQKILVDIRRELYEHVLQLPLQFYRNTQAGTVINSMAAELNAVGVFLGNAIATPISSVLTFAAFAGYMLFLDLRLGLISLSIYPLELIAIPLLQKRFNFHNRNRVNITRDMSNTINEAISGIHEVHGNASYRLEKTKLDASINKLFAVMYRLFIIKFGIKFTNNLIQSFGPFILFLYGGYLAIHGEFTLGALVAFLSAYEKVYDPWGEMVDYYQEYQDAKVRYQRVMEIFDVEPEYALAPPDNRQPYQLDGAIDLRDVGYSIAGVNLLNNINLQVEPKEQIALVGFSGSGKTTLALILGQLYQYDQGKVLLDGHDLNGLSKLDISRNIGFVAQHPFIFTGTIRDNLLYSCDALKNNDSEPETSERPSDATILEMVSAVGLSDDIVRLGLNTVIPRERCKPLIDKFLRMRQIVALQKSDQLQGIVEHYNVRVFHDHATLYENLIFGEFLDESYSQTNIVRNPVFISFLKENDIYKPLLTLGKNLLFQTAMLFRDFADDDFFLKASPIPANDFEMYLELADRLNSPKDRDYSSKQAAMLLSLALRYLPARHKMVALPKTLKEQIIKCRHTFMQEIGGIDLEACQNAAQQMIAGGPPITTYAKNDTFISYCPTQYQYSHSLLDNIIYGNIVIAHAHDTATIVQLVTDQLRKEGLLDEIMNIGLDFHVGSKGDRLSGGQKQKVALARVLLKTPRILIMDEATASLDNASQTKVQELIKTKIRGESTVVTVIHRLDMAPDFDRIVVLKSGQIIEEGSYQELMQQKGAFYELATGT